MDKKEKTVKRKLTLDERIDAPTPRFWRIMRHIGVGLAAAAGIASVFVTGGGTLPLVIQVAGIAGGGLAGISQIQVAKPDDLEAIGHAVDTLEKIKDVVKK